MFILLQHFFQLSFSSCFYLQILNLLPQTVRGIVHNVRQESTAFFSFTVRLDISTKEDALTWLREFEETTLTTYKVLTTFAENTQKIVFKVNNI